MKIDPELLIGKAVFVDFYNTLWVDQTLNDDLLETLRLQRENTQGLFMLTSGKISAEVEQQLQLQFDYIFDADNSPGSKQDSDTYVNLSALIQVELAKCLLVDDLDSNLQAAKSAGWGVLGL